MASTALRTGARFSWPGLAGALTGFAAGRKLLGSSAEREHRPVTVCPTRTIAQSQAYTGRAQAPVPESIGKPPWSDVRAANGATMWVEALDLARTGEPEPEVTDRVTYNQPPIWVGGIWVRKDRSKRSPPIKN